MNIYAHVDVLIQSMRRFFCVLREVSSEEHRVNRSILAVVPNHPGTCGNDIESRASAHAHHFSLENSPRPIPKTTPRHPK